MHQCCTLFTIITSTKQQWTNRTQANILTKSIASFQLCKEAKRQQTHALQPMKPLHTPLHLLQAPLRETTHVYNAAITASIAAPTPATFPATVAALPLKGVIEGVTPVSTPDAPAPLTVPDGISGATVTEPTVDVPATIELPTTIADVATEPDATVEAGAAAAVVAVAGPAEGVAAGALEVEAGAAAAAVAAHLHTS